VDRAIVDQAPLIPPVMPEAVDVVSSQVGNYQNNPSWGFLLDQAWVK
jgi:ABC-type transport system substrate-binding protein